MKLRIPKSRRRSKVVGTSIRGFGPYRVIVLAPTGQVTEFRFLRLQRAWDFMSMAYRAAPTCRVSVGDKRMEYKRPWRSLSKK